MIIDTSALMANLLNENERAQFAELILAAEPRLISAGSWIEMGAVASRVADQEFAIRAAALRVHMKIEIVPTTSLQAHIGHEAYLKYGKGNHRARLNFGDCFAYALAKETGQRLLFKGNDFTHTDITPAI